ncbi:LysR family transcriptional regulator [Brachybacterium sp. ACRRE]|uniref:LysR family transcriptional regulator n=1 Tax=Brachybacterium sp. ACRRE TaxID=2918184 RepID=UPI001EF2CEB3|nr:LysR family transcriptional regulator [Brachybacterium sp. ACRRE]MCG7310891.1 LysR family transcriptional regulator [Brachybacterium sp. ACRRE]
MDVRHLELLREFAARGSVTAVAAATHRTPSAVSQQLRAAQRDLGVQLVRPQGRGLRLTEAGELLARGGDEVAEAVAGVASRLDDLLGAPSGTVDVLALASAAVYLYPQLVSTLEGSGIDLVLHDDDIAETAFAQLTADHDIVIGHSLAGPAPKGSERCRVVPLGSEPLDVAMAADHPLACRASLTAADLADQEWIGVPEGFPFDRVLQTISLATGTPLRVAQRLRDNHLIEALVARSDLLAILPRFTTRTDRGIALRPVEGVPTLRHVSALMRPDAAQRSAVRRVLEVLREAADAATRAAAGAQWAGGQSTAGPSDARARSTGHEERDEA